MNEESICYRTYAAVVDEVEALSLVRECRELEERYGSDFTAQILESADHLDGTCINSQKGREMYQAEGSKRCYTSQNIKIPTHSQNHHGNWLEKTLGSSHGPQHIYPLSRA